MNLELLVMNLISEVEEMYLSEECKSKVIYDGVVASLDENLKEKRISSAEYQQALDILRGYKLVKKDQV